MPEFISMRELARRVGVTLRAVQVAVRDGRILIDKSEHRGKKVFHFFDAKKAISDWSKNRDPSKLNRLTNRQKKENPNVADGEPLNVPGAKSTGGSVSTPGGQSKYQQARTAKEAINARLAELDYKKKIGELVPLSKVKILVYNLFRTTRERMMNIPDRFLSVLVSKLETSIRKALPELDEGEKIIDHDESRALLKAEIISALSELSDEKFNADDLK